MDLRSSERLANARLIAAAPDLLAAAQEALMFLDGLGEDLNRRDSYIDYRSQRNALRAAVAKTEGRDAS